MTENEKIRQHEAICAELTALYKKKNRDYGDAFHASFLEEGMAMPRIRLGDKFNRFKNLTRSGLRQVVDFGSVEASAAQNGKPMYRVTVYELRQGSYGSRSSKYTIYVSSLSELVPEDETAKAYGLLKINAGYAIFYVDPSNVEIVYQ